MTEQEKIQELLKPRVKIIAPWPDIPKTAVGNIYVLCEDEPGYWYTTVFGKTYTQSTIDEYPHLFKYLEWWEDRKPEEMPEFVKDKFNQVHKVTSVERIGANLEKGFYAHWKNVQPATIIEYTEYQNNRNEREA